MKLAAVLIVWDDWELLEKAVENLTGLVDGFIIVASETSSYGEISPIPVKWRNKVYVREPFFNHPMNCETDKRNFGLDVARRLGYTHFLPGDADEFYDRQEFLRARQRFYDEPDLVGLVCATQVYFASPELTIGLDTTLIPFIHKILPGMRHEMNRRYPFAWDNGRIRIDPTRQMNINSGVKWDDIIMHHVSWFRRDYEKKIRNSTARDNIKRSSILNDLLHATDGYFCQFYQKRLTRCSDRFGLNELFSKSL